MAIKVYRNSKESADRLISRFNKRVQASRILILVKERRYHKKKPSNRHERMRAIMRDYHRKQKEKMKFY